MHKFSHPLTAAIGAAAFVCAAPALAGGEAGRLVLRDLGEKFVGYTTVPAENGSLNVVNGMFVQYMLPANRRCIRRLSSHPRYRRRWSERA